MFSDRLMRTAHLVMISLFLGSFLQAHHPDRQSQPVYPRIDVIGPIGSNLPMSYRRRYNRPTNWGGKIAYKIAPSSQEAMAWHDATHRGLYENDRPRVEMHYFYPKPWEALQIGPRPRTTVQLDRQTGETVVVPEDAILESEVQAVEPAGQHLGVPVDQLGPRSADEPMAADRNLLEL